MVTLASWVEAAARAAPCRLMWRSSMGLGLSRYCPTMSLGWLMLTLIQIECGAQFSLALSKTGVVWTWGKGDYFRLGHGADQHVRKPTMVESLRGKKMIHVAVGALHCLAVTDQGQVSCNMICRKKALRFIILGNDEKTQKILLPIYCANQTAN